MMTSPGYSVLGLYTVVLDQNETSDDDTSVLISRRIRLTNCTIIVKRRRQPERDLQHMV